MLRVRPPRERRRPLVLTTLPGLRDENAAKTIERGLRLFEFWSRPQVHAVRAQAAVPVPVLLRDVVVLLHDVRHSAVPVLRLLALDRVLGLLPALLPHAGQLLRDVLHPEETSRRMSRRRRAGLGGQFILYKSFLFSLIFFPCLMT